MGKQGLVQFESIALNGRVYFPGPTVDSPGQSESIFQSVAMEPRTTVENVTPPVIIKDDRFLGGL